MRDDAAIARHDFMIELIGLVEDNEIEAVESLLQHHTDITEDMLGPSMVKAAVKGYTEVMRLLVAHGANVNKKSSIGTAPLMVAALWGRTETGRFLIDSGAALDLADEGGTTALMSAAMADRVEMVQLLIDCGADVDARNLKGETAQSIAENRRHENIVGLLEAARGKFHAIATENQRKLNARMLRAVVSRRPCP